MYHVESSPWNHLLWIPNKTSPLLDPKSYVPKYLGRLVVISSKLRSPEKKKKRIKTCVPFRLFLLSFFLSLFVCRTFQASCERRSSWDKTEWRIFQVSGGVEVLWTTAWTVFMHPQKPINVFKEYLLATFSLTFAKLIWKGKQSFCQRSNS